MRRALVLAAVTALAVARPEMYKEKEDFQYSRSSSDEGTKSGFYGAQRGNMGGNYERAHNMDLLAQHQMGGLVKTVDGDLGDGARQKSGSVFSAANSRGVFGSGNYDLSNLEGRNFQEGTSFGQSQSHSSLSSQQSSYGSQARTHSSAANSVYGSQSQNSRYQGYQTAGNADQAQYATGMHSADNLQSASQLYDGTQASRDSGYYSHSGYQGQNVYDQAAAAQHLSNAYGTSSTRGSQYRLVGASPVRVYIRPGSTITIPVAAQSYDTSDRIASTFDQNSINSETQVLGARDQHVIRPTNEAKHYESSYNYRKEWEKHDTVPVTVLPIAVPTVNPYPSNSELYEDTLVQGSEHKHEASAQESRNVHSSSQYRGYNVKTGASGHQVAYNTQAQRASDSGVASAASSNDNSHGAYNYGVNNLNTANLESQVEDFGSKPKSYQSSYSYHKSWERQGDPYVIKPSTNGLYTAVDSQAAQRLTSSLNQGSSYGSHYHQGRGGYSNDPNCDCDENGHIRVARSYNLDRDQAYYQQSQDVDQGQEYAGQQSQNLQDFGQQSQNLQDFGQVSQNLENLDQQSQNLQDFGQNLENLGQQSQNLEDLSQQTQNLQSFGQESLNLGGFGQQYENVQDFGQLTQNLDNFGQQTQDLGQLTQSNFDKELGQQTQDQWDQQSQTGAGQETQNTWNMLETIQHSNVPNTAQQPQSSVFDIEHPSMHHLEPQAVDASKSNLFEHTNLGKEDIEKEFMQSEDVGQHSVQHTQFQWQSGQPSVYQNTHTVNVPVTPLETDQTYQGRPDWHKYLDNQNLHIDTGYGHNHHQHYQTGVDANSWIFSQPNNVPTPGYVNTRYDPNSWAFNPSYSHPNVHPNPQYGNTYTQTFITRHNHSTFSTNNVQVKPNDAGSTSLTNLWDLIDDIEKQTTTQNDTDFSSNDWYQKKNEEQNNKVHFIETSTSTTTTIKQDNLDSHDVERGDVAPEKIRPLEEPGRGDIGPADSSDEESNIQNKPLDTLETKPASPSHYKTPEEIESLSLTKEKNETAQVNSHTLDEERQVNLDKENKQLETVLGVISVNEQKLHHSEEDNWRLQSNTQRTTSTTPKINYGDDNDHPIFNIEQEAQQNTEQQVEPLGQIENLNQQNYNPFEQNVNFDQQNVNLDQQNVNFDQQNVDLDQQNVNFDQQNVNLDQQNVNFDQQNVNLDQQNVNLDQQNVNLYQQNIDHQLADFGQQSEPTGQKLESFDQENVNLDQQNVNLDQQNIDQHVANVEHGPEDIQQENLNQQFETLGQQTEDLNQQTFNQFEDLGQQSGHFGQEPQTTDTFGQQSQGFQQESLGDFSLHEQIPEPLSSFDQQSKHSNSPQNEQQLEDIGQKNENLEQQSQTEDLWEPDVQQLQQSQVEVIAPVSPYNKEGRTPMQNEPIVEPEIVKQTTNNVDTPPEPVTEKTGFWNKVGSKFSNAKDKVKSWFSSS